MKMLFTERKLLIDKLAMLEPSHLTSKIVRSYIEDVRKISQLANDEDAYYD